MSHELEEMRSQIGVLKKKLEKQNIVNEKHIRNSMKSKMSSLNNTITVTIFLGIFALLFCPWYFLEQGCSYAFVISTAVMLAACLVLTIIQRVNLGRMDFSKGNLVETAQTLSKIKIHYQGWHKIAIPMIVIWLGWMSYEMVGVMGIDGPMAIGFFCGAAVGVVIGGIAGRRVNRKVVAKAGEILEQIEELRGMEE